MQNHLAKASQKKLPLRKIKLEKNKFLLSAQITYEIA